MKEACLVLPVKYVTTPPDRHAGVMGGRPCGQFCARRGPQAFCFGGVKEADGSRRYTDAIAHVMRASCFCLHLRRLLDDEETPCRRYRRSRRHRP